jgi:DNA modification methylase
MNARPPITVPRGEILIGDAMEQLRRLPDSSVDCVVTSPPYFRLRDYGPDTQIGLEPAVEDWVERLAAILGEVERVLVPTGTLWLNLGDTYATHPRQGAHRKSLLLGPERLLLRLQAAGWIVRNKLVWAKPNPMPISVTDRLAATYEFVYLLAKQPTYFFDLDVIRVPHTSAPVRQRATQKRSRRASWLGPNSLGDTGLAAIKAQGRVGHPLGKNPGDVWTIAPGGYRSTHHAIFPLGLAERMITAGCPEARCSRCRLPWKRRLIRTLGGTATRAALAPTCDCRAASEPGLVLDPFMGSGTSAVAATRLGRDWLGIELSPAFAAAATERIAKAQSASTTGEKAA